MCDGDTVPGVFPREGDEGRVQGPVPPVPEPWPKVSGGGNNSGSVSPSHTAYGGPTIHTMYYNMPTIITTYYDMPHDP